MDHTKLHELTLLQAIEGIRSGSFTCRQYNESLLKRQKHYLSYNYTVHSMDETAILEKADEVDRLLEQSWYIF
jgi:hypothetical protein